MSTIRPLQCPSRLATAKAIFEKTGNRTLVFHPGAHGIAYVLRKGLTPGTITKVTGISDFSAYGINLGFHDTGLRAGFGDVSTKKLDAAIKDKGIPSGFDFYRPTDPSDLQWQDITLPQEHQYRYRAEAANMMLARIVVEESPGRGVFFRTRISLALEGLPRENRPDMLQHYLTALFGANRDYDLAKALATIVAIELNPLRQGRMGDQAEFLEEAGFRP